MRPAKKVINSMLRSLAGYEIRRIGPDARTVQTAAEIEALCRQTVFPALPDCDGRGTLLSELMGTSLVEALFLLNELSQTVHLEGDVCEFGVAQGTTSALIANEIRHHASKNLWLFDSFEGLPRPTPEKDRLLDDIFSLGSIEKYQGQMAVKQRSVLSRMKASRIPMERVRIVPGFIEKTSQLATSLPKRVCFAYVDFDFYEPILIALRLLLPRLPQGGRIMVDDYGFFSAGAQAAVDEFLLETNGIFDKRLPQPGTGHFVMMTRVR